MSDLSKKFKKACRNFTIGTALVTTMVGGTMGLATPKDAHALSNAELAGIAAGGAVLLGLGYKAFGGGGSGSGGSAVDPRCSTTINQSQNYGYSFGGSTNTSIYCPPATAGYGGGGGGYQAVQQPQQVVVQQAPARSSADIEKDMMLLDGLRHERQMRALERDADFYNSVPGIRMQQATGFCMNVTDGKSLDAPNRKDCAKILNRSAKGQAFLASMGRSDLLSAETAGASGGGDGALCQTETVKESYGADGKMTGRTIEKAMKPCNPKM